MKYLSYCLALSCLLPLAARAESLPDNLADWTARGGPAHWIPLGNTHGTDVYLLFSHEGRIADITLKSGIYDPAHQLKQVNIITGYFGCPEGEMPQYLEHAVSTTYDATSHSPVNTGAGSLNGDPVPVTSGSVIESAAKLACSDALADRQTH